MSEREYVSRYDWRQRYGEEIWEMRAVVDDATQAVIAEGTDDEMHDLAADLMRHPRTLSMAIRGGYLWSVRRRLAE